MSLGSAFAQAGISSFPLHPRAVCKVKESVLNFPEGTNNPKKERWVLVLSNRIICNTFSCPVVMVAILSTKVKWATPAEIFFNPTATNGLNAPSRLLLGHMQPVRKCDFERKVGEFSQAEWDAVVDKIISNIDG